MISRLLLALALALAATAQASAQQTTWPPLGGKPASPSYGFYAYPKAYLGQPSQPICQLKAGATVNSDGETCLSNPKAGVGYQAVTLTGASTLALPTNIPANGGLSILYMITHSGADGPILGIGIQTPSLLQPPTCNGTTVTTGCWSTTAGAVDWLPCVTVNGGSMGCSFPITNVGQLQTPALVSQATGSGVNTFTTSGIATTGANLLIAVVTGDNTPVISDSSSNSWVPAATKTNGSTVTIYYAANASVSASQTFTLTGTNIFAVLGVTAWTVTAPAVDQSNTNSATAGTSVTTGSVTPLQNHELVIAGLVTTNGNTSAASIGGGFTMTSMNLGFGSGAHEGGAAAYLIQSVPAAANPTFSWTTAGDSGAAIATFR